MMPENEKIQPENKKAQSEEAQGKEEKALSAEESDGVSEMKKNADITENFRRTIRRTRSYSTGGGDLSLGKKEYPHNQLAYSLPHDQWNQGGRAPKVGPQIKNYSFDTKNVKKTMGFKPDPSRVNKGSDATRTQSAPARTPSWTAAVTNPQGTPKEISK